MFIANVVESLSPLIPSFEVRDRLVFDLFRYGAVFLAAAVIVFLSVRWYLDRNRPDRAPALMALGLCIGLDLVDELQQIGRPFVLYRLPVRYVVLILTLIYLWRRARQDRVSG